MGQILPPGVNDGAVSAAAGFSRLAKELNTNIVCGSVANKRTEGYFNTAYVFDFLLTIE